MLKRFISFLVAISMLFSVCITASAEEIPTEHVTEEVSEYSTEDPSAPITPSSTFNSETRYQLIFLLVIVALCYFQTLLSSKDNKYLGMIIPVISFTASVVLTFAWSDSFSIPKVVTTLIFVNIPTYIFILIYRHKRKKK